MSEPHYIEIAGTVYFGASVEPAPAPVPMLVPCPLGLSHPKPEDMTNQIATLTTELQQVEKQMDDLGETVEGKQDAITLGDGLDWDNLGQLEVDFTAVQTPLTPGENITIQDGVIAAEGGNTTIDDSASGSSSYAVTIGSVLLKGGVTVKSAGSRALTTIEGPACGDHTITRHSALVRADDGHTLRVSTSDIRFGRQGTTQTTSVTLPSNGLSDYVVVPCKLVMPAGDYASSGILENVIPTTQVTLSWADTIDGVSGYWLLDGALIGMQGGGAYADRIELDKGIFAGIAQFLCEGQAPSEATTSGVSSGAIYGRLRTDTSAQSNGLDFTAYSGS